LAIHIVTFEITKLYRTGVLFLYKTSIKKGGVKMAHILWIWCTAITKWILKVPGGGQPSRNVQATTLPAVRHQDLNKYHHSDPCAPFRGIRMGSSVILILALVAFSTSVDAEQRIALLIGNQAYAKEVGPLKNPINDIDRVGAALSKIGFKVERVQNAGLRETYRALNKYIRSLGQAGDGAIGFFYYSGHGGANPDTNVNYLIPVDIEDADEESLWDYSLPLQQVISDLSNRASKATHFVVFDACRNELQLKKKGTKTLSRRKGFQPERQQPGMLIAYSTAPGEIASDEGEGAGPYATVLAEELIKPGLEAVAMFRQVQLKVYDKTGQSPWLRFPSLPEIHLAGGIDLSERFLEEQANRAQVRAVELLDDGQFDRAVDELRETGRILTILQEKRPADFGLIVQKGYYYKTLSVIFHQAGKTERAEEAQESALKLCQKVIDEAPPDMRSTNIAGAHNLKGNIYGQRGEYRKAIKSYEVATELNPRYAYAWHDMFLAYVGLAQQGDVNIQAMRRAFNMTKETGMGKPGLGAAHIARLESILKQYESKKVP
jgi:tetratricopeptide (TPR) repeat protein